MQHAAMSLQQMNQTLRCQGTPPSSFVDTSLTPSPTDKFTQVHQVLALFATIQGGRQRREKPWNEFQLIPGEYEEIERQLEQDETLWGYVKDKIRCASKVLGRNGV